MLKILRTFILTLTNGGVKWALMNTLLTEIIKKHWKYGIKGDRKYNHLFIAMVNKDFPVILIDKDGNSSTSSSCTGISPKRV